MNATLGTQESSGDPAQRPPAAKAALEHKVAQLRQRLKAAEQQAASESEAHRDQAKLAKTMARAARAEAREREALSRANAELAALVRAMENELAALKAEHAGTPEPMSAADRECAGPADDSVRPARDGSEMHSVIKRRSIWIPRVAVAALCLAAVGAVAGLYPVVTAFLDGHAGPFSGRVTVVDGDTIHVDGKTLRLLGIDAPPAGTPAGKRATRYLQTLTAGQDVRCETDGRQTGANIQARCFIGAVDIGQVMMLSGNAAARELTQTGHRRPR